MINTRTKSVRSIDRAISILKCFSLHRLELSGAEVAQEVGLSVTTAHRILSCLSKGGFVTRNERTLKYTVGPEIYRIGNLFMFSLDLTRIAEPVVKLLNEMTGEVVNVAIRNEDVIFILLREESKFPIALRLYAGTTLPAHATSLGKALLSELSADELDKVYPSNTLSRLTDKTITDKANLKRELDSIRRTGLAFSREETHEGSMAVATLIRNAAGKAIAALSIGVPIYRMSIQKESILSQLVIMAADLISYRLGYQVKPNTITDSEALVTWWNKSKLQIFKENETVLRQ